MKPVNQVLHDNRCGWTCRRLGLALAVGLALGTLASGTCVAATATPRGGKVVGGAGTITQRGVETIIRQRSKLMAIDWKSFDVGKNASVLFDQPSGRAVALNRILDQDPSRIFGKVTSNGRIFLINTHGIIFGASARLNVGGLVASTLDLTPDDFLARNFTLDARGGHAGIVNHGIIAAASGGSVTLLGGHVANDGVIVADYGHINLDGASRAVLDFDGNGLIHVQITGKLKQRLQSESAAVVNKGTLKADAGTVVLKAAAAEKLFTNLVNNTGVIKAQGISTAGGVVRLVGRGGNVTDSGDIDVSGEHGGTAHVLSDHDVMITDQAVINASGRKGGGNIRIGGGIHGGEGLMPARRTYLAADAVLQADAQHSGNGGRVAVWSTDNTVVAGTISARGGAEGGDGGFVETSGIKAMTVTRAPDVSAFVGDGGTWLLDPVNLTISNNPDNNVNGNSPFEPQGGGANLSTGTIQTALATGNVTISTGGASGSDQGNIKVDGFIHLFGGQNLNRKLTLKARGDIRFTSNGKVAAQGGSSLGVELVADGSVVLDAGSSVFTAGAAMLVQAGQDVQFLQGSNVATSVGNNAGALTIDADGAVTLDELYVGALNVTAGSGISQSHGWQVGGAAVLDAGAGKIKLGNTHNQFVGMVTLSNTGDHTVTFDNGDHDLTLGELALGSAGATIRNYRSSATLSGDVIVAGGDLSFDAGIKLASGSITMGASDETGNAAVIISGDIAGNHHNLKINARGGAAAFGKVTAIKNLTVTSGSLDADGTLDIDNDLTLHIGGDIEQNDRWSVGGLSTFDSGHDITLANHENSFDHAVMLNGHNAEIHDEGVLEFGTSTLSGTLKADATLGISQSGTLSVGETSTLRTDAGEVILANHDNDFGGVVDVDGVDQGISLYDKNTLTVEHLAEQQYGNVSLIAEEELKGVGAIDADGNITLKAKGGALDTQKLTGQAITLTGADGITLHGDLAASGNLVLTSTDAAIEQVDTKVTSVGGTTTIDAGSGDITLKQDSNTFAQAVSLTGHDANVHADGVLKLAQSTLTGNLTAIATSDISQSGKLSIDGTSTLNAGTGEVTLADPDNDFGGAVDVTGQGISLYDTNTLTVVNLAEEQGGDVILIAGKKLNGVGTIVTDGNITLKALGGKVLAQQLVGKDITLVGANGITLQGDLDAGGILILSSTNADIKQEDYTAVSATDETTIDAGSGNIVLGNTGNDFQNTVKFVGGNVTLHNVNALTFGDGSAAGTLEASTDNAKIVQTATGTLDVGGEATFDAGTADVQLGNHNNAFRDVVNVTGENISLASNDVLDIGNLDNHGTGDVVLFANNDLSGLDQAITAAGGTIKLSVLNGALTLTKTLQAGTIELDGGTGLALHGDVHADDALTLASSNALITQSNDSTVTAVDATINAGTGDIQLQSGDNDFTGVVSVAGSAIALTDASDLTIGGFNHSGSGAVSLLAGGNLTGTTGMDAGSGDLTLVASGGALDVLALAGGNVRLSGATGITLGGDVVAGGELDLASTDASIMQQAGTINVTGTTDVDAGDGSIALALVGNDFGGTLSLTGGDTHIADQGALSLGALHVGDFDVVSHGALSMGAGDIAGTLHASSNGGDVTQTGKLGVAGPAVISADTGNVALTDPDNDFHDAVTLVAGNADMRDATALSFETLTLTGYLNATSGDKMDLGAGTIGADLTAASDAGGIIQSTAAGDHLEVIGMTHLDAGSGAVTLFNAGNAFGQSVDAAGAGISLRDKDDLIIASITDRDHGDVKLIAGGTLTGVGDLDTDGGDITLGAWGGALSAQQLTGGNIRLRGRDGITLEKNVFADGTLTLISSDADISQNPGAHLTVEQAATIDAGSGNIQLSSAANDFKQVVALTGTDAVVIDANDLTLGMLQLGGDLSAHGGDALSLGSGAVGGSLEAVAGHGIAQSGALTVGGDSTLHGHAGKVALTHAGNDFVGTVVVAGTGIDLVDRNNLHVSQLTDLADGDVSLVAGGALPLPGAIDVGGGTLLLASGSALDVNYALTGHAVTLHGNGITLNKAVTAATSLRLESTGDIIQDTSDGAFSASRLTADVDGSAALIANNQVSTLGNFNATSLDLHVAGGLTIVDGATVDGGNSMNLSLGGGDLAIDGRMHATLVTLRSPGAIREGAHGGIRAVIFTGKAAGEAALAGLNDISELDSFSSDGLVLHNRRSLTLLQGSVVDGGSSVALQVSGAHNDLILDGVLTGSTLSLQAGGDIRQGNTGRLVGDQLSGHSGGSTHLTGANDVARLADFSADGFALTTDPGLLVVAGGTVDGGSGVALTTTGTGNDIDIQGTVTGDQVDLVASGGIVQGDQGSIKAGTLSGQSHGDVVLDGRNHIAALGDFTAGKFHLLDAHALTIGGALHADAVTLDVAGDLAIEALVDSGSGTITLRQHGAGSITGTADGSLRGSVLTGYTEGATMLGSATQYMDNRISVVGGFVSPDGFSLTNGKTLTLTSVDDSGFTINAGTSDLYLAVRNGDILQNGKDWLYNGGGTWAVSGHIGLKEAPIYVRGVSSQRVAAIGEPPAYFYALSPDGVVLPVTGAGGVNVPQTTKSERWQNISSHVNHHVDIGAVTATYRSYGVVQPGILLPADQRRCTSHSTAHWCPERD